MPVTPEEFEWIGRIMRSDHVRDVLDQTADAIAARVNAVTSRDGHSSKSGPRADVVTRASGTRPGTRSPTGAKRPYARVGITFRTRAQAVADLEQAAAASAIAGARNPKQ